MMDVQIFELGSAPEQDLRDAFELHRTLQLEMSPGHKSLSYEATIASWKSIVDYCQTRHWVARVDNRIVGIAKTEIEIREDNQDQAWLDVNVLPEFRRRGIGAALARPALVHAASCSRTLIGAEAGQDHPGEEFLTFLGLTKRLLWRVSRVHMDAIPPALMHKWISAASAIADGLVATLGDPGSCCANRPEFPTPANQCGPQSTRTHNNLPGPSQALPKVRIGPRHRLCRLTNRHGLAGLFRPLSANPLCNQLFLGGVQNAARQRDSPT